MLSVCDEVGGGLATTIVWVHYGSWVVNQTSDLAQCGVVNDVRNVHDLPGNYVLWEFASACILLGGFDGPFQSVEVMRALLG